MNRRQFVTAAGAAGLGSALPGRAAGPQSPRGAAEHCIFIWLGGGAAQIDTFDPKATGDAKQGNKKPGSYYPSIETAVPGIRVCEHLHRTARLMERITAVRTCHHGARDEHAAAINIVHTGRPVSGTVSYPSIGSIVADRRGPAADGAPAYVVLGLPNPSRAPGFLGPKAGYLYATDTAGPAGLRPPHGIDPARSERRAALLETLRGSARGRRPDDRALRDYDEAIALSQRLAGPEFMKVFDLESEAAGLRESYGGEFGQRCLLARRLVERGVRFIEVSHNLGFKNGTGWDTHKEGQLKQHILIRQLDDGLAALIEDLEARKLLDRTLIAIATEFGRPAGFDGQGGRGHHSGAFTMVLAGGGLRHRGAHGVTDDLAMKALENPVSLADFHATIHAALGIDPGALLHDGDRPVPVTDRGRAIGELFG